MGDADPHDDMTLVVLKVVPGGGAGVTGEREDELHALERRLGHRFADLALLDRALTHASLANETATLRHGDNEALEFLGDSVLGLVVTDLLHRRDPDGAEGAKSRRRAQLVSAPSLARRAAELGLPELLLLGRGEEKTGGREKAALWANAYEAVRGGALPRRRLRGRAALRAGASSRGTSRPRTRSSRTRRAALQELLQGQGRPVPRYTVVGGGGAEPPPALPRRVPARRRPVTSGEGYSKKAAQQEAAREALQRLRRSARQVIPGAAPGTTSVSRARCYTRPP